MMLIFIGAILAGWGREIVELWAHGDGLEEVVEQTRQIPASAYEGMAELSFRFDVDDYMQKIPFDAQLALINRFSFMPLRGPVSIGAPQLVFSLHCDATTGRHYFGRLIGTGRRDLVDRFNLKKRSYLGTTSMDAELSLVMCNMAGVRAGDLVYDPFVGTGSLLCTSAFFGGLPLGSDIDGRQMRGQEGRSIYSNLTQYGLTGRFVGGLVFDVLHHPWRDGFTVDAIITDPPYGVRAGAKKIGTRSPYPPSQSVFLSPEERAVRYPKTVPYEMDELARDLHIFAQKILRPSGRLVYWHPVEGEEERTNEEQLRARLPQVEGLCLVAAIPQRCRMFDRWLVTFEKRRSA